MLKPILASIALVGLLAACSPGDAELDGDMEVNGMEPAFWGVKVVRAENKATINVLGERDIVGEAPVKSTGEKATILTSKTPEGDFVMTLTRADCKDGLGDREYHWSVSASWKGETLKGCAAPAKPADPAAG
ncbi:MAG TPA: hypothetical protein PLN33_14075 [Hyphomonadaceae bacterium]|nr:hypothetical protein [Hyphomonadaceae bacterium]HPN06367.1 hypothetical protein [Hyphomonadaceae bacterium]